MLEDFLWDNPVYVLFYDAVNTVCKKQHVLYLTGYIECFGKSLMHFLTN